jgi:hypothetical protein
MGKMFKKAALCAALLALLAPATRAQSSPQGDPDVLSAMTDFNGILRAEWMDLRVQIEQIELLTLERQHSISRLHRQPFRWVAGDPRRQASGNDLIYRVDFADGLGKGLDPVAAEGAIDRAMATWGADSCFQKGALIKGPEDGADADIFDSRYGYGGFGDYRLADVVHAGWLPAGFFEAVTGPGGGKSVVALSVTFIFVDRDGQPSDLDHDGYLDTAHAEIYYNQAFPWGAGGLDLETVALHESGHALGLPHVGPCPAVMNPWYAGPRRELQPLDHAALCGVWANEK